MSGLKTRSLGLNTLGTTWSPASSQSVLVSAVCPGKLSWDLGFESHPKDWRSPEIEPTTTGLEGEQLNYYATEASMFYHERV